MAKEKIRTYKIIGRFPNEARTFKNNVRIQFKGYSYTTSNPTEIATIEGSTEFKKGIIRSVEKAADVRTGPDTTGAVGSTGQFKEDPAEIKKLNAALETKAEEVSDKDAEIAELKAQLAEKEETPTDPPADTETEGEGEGEGEGASEESQDPPTETEGEGDTSDPPAEGKGGKKKASSKKT